MDNGQWRIKCKSAVAQIARNLQLVFFQITDCKQSVLQMSGNELCSYEAEITYTSNELNKTECNFNLKKAS